MKKQEFIAMSIFSSLHYMDNESNVVELHCIDSGVGLVNFGWGDAKEYTEVKPILHSLSDLTKEIEHKGEKFVPIEEIFNHPLCYIEMQNDLYESICVFGITQKPFWIVEKLIEWHFDLFGGIDNGEAIDVNTLKINPYK